jgi:hypothetical protein
MLHASQKEKLSTKKFSELSEKEQLGWCREQQKLGSMAYEAYKLVKANAGAAGVDEESLEDFATL